MGNLQIEAYNELVQDYLQVLGLYRPELDREKNFTVNNYYLEIGYSRYHENQVFNALHNNYETLLWKNWYSFTHHTRVHVHKNIKTKEIYTHTSQ